MEHKTSNNKEIKEYKKKMFSCTRIELNNTVLLVVKVLWL